jgi:sugar O-acyltransferase (sialic acid O-acetyltransferase NeuD family)
MKIFVYGAKGHGKVVADILLAGNHEVTGFIDDDERLDGSTVLGLPVLGGETQLRSAADEGNTRIALGVGDNQIRQKLFVQCQSWGVEVISAIHPSAAVSKSAKVKQGTVVMAGAVINPCALIGLAVIVNSGSVIEHDVVVGDYAHVSPNAVMGGESELGPLSHLGLGAVILPRVVVGSRSVIGAGAVVTRNLPDNIVAVGVPARVRNT